MMKIGVLGAGYVGLVSAVGFAEMGNQVQCADIDKQKISQLQDDIISIYEPGLKELVRSNRQAGRLKFTDSIQDTINTSDIIIVAVGTPAKVDGQANLDHVFDAARCVGQSMRSQKYIVIKSTVPVGTGQKLKTLIRGVLSERNLADLTFEIISNPEFLKEGAALNDFMKPDRIVIGCESKAAQELMEKLYAPFVRNGHPLLFMDVASSEMTKYASNAMLATKISFINEMANICEHVGADISMVRKGIGTDKRIGPHFIYPGLGYGGSCFPKDINALISVAQDNKVNTSILKAVEETNQHQRQRFLRKIYNYFNGNLSEKKIAVWGLAFKPLTNDMRKAPSIEIIGELISWGAKIHAYDPVANEKSVPFLDQSAVQYYQDPYTPLKDCEALLLLTEWREFREPDFDRIKKNMKSPLIFDGRNQYSPTHLKENGFKYISIGRAPV